MFQVDIIDLLANKFQLMVQDSSQQSTTIDTWYYWEYEQYIKLLNIKNKEQKEQKDQQDKNQQEQSGGMSNFNPGKIMNGFNPSSFNGGGTSSFPRI